MKNIKYAVLIFSLFFISCESSNKNKTLIKKPVIIAGKIENPKTELVSVDYQDIVNGSVHYSQVIDTLDGTFKFVFDLVHGQDLRFEYNNTFITLFAEPSDSLFIKINTTLTDSKNSIVFSGSNKIINEEINKYLSYKKIPPFNTEFEGKSVKEYHNNLKFQIKNELLELDCFVKKFEPSAKFIKWAKNDIIYNNSNFLIDYKFYLTNNNLPLTDSLFDSELFPTDNEQAFISSMFGVYLWNYAYDKYIQNNSIVKDLLSKGKTLEAYRLCIKKILEEEKKGLIRDIIVFKVILTIAEESLTNPLNLTKKIDYKIDNPVLASELELRLHNASNNGKILKFNSRGIHSEVTQNVMDILKKESEGRTIYVDFWAIWCGTCRAEIPSLIKLNEKIKNKNIQIVSFCFDSDRNAWYALIKEKKIPGIHYLLSKEQASILKSKLKIQGFPRYMIIKNGMVIDSNSLRPSSHEKLLKELLRNSAM